MTAVETRQIADSALAMPAKKRAALAHSLLASLPPRRQRTWEVDAVLAKRAREVADGTAATISADDAMRDIRARLCRK